VHIELRRKGVTLMLLWAEYRAAHEGQRTWAYTQFCGHYKEFAKTLKRSMRQQRRAGEKLFIDYAGATLELADGSRAQVFVAAMGASSYTFACATADQSMRSWLGAMARALTFYGGVPQLIVPDNPRALVSEACRYEPRLNQTVHDFARHYGVSILPARPYSPKDKAWTSYCTLCGRWSGDEPGGLAAVAAADAAQQLTTIGRLVQAAVIVAIEVTRQRASATEVVDGCRTYTELFGHLFASEHAALSQPFEAAAQLIGTANDDDLLQRERLTAPIAVPEFVEPLGDLLVA
jgi:hypothetical protein